MTDKNSELFLNSKKYIPGGVNSPVRAFKSVGRDPLFITHGMGPKIWDSNGFSYIDFICSWGALILGHAHPVVVHTVSEIARKGLSFGTPTSYEYEMAELIVKSFKSIDQVRLVSSGTEATMSAIRLARGYTKRDIVVKFEGCYHGHVDSLLVKAGSGSLTFGKPSSLGVPAAFSSKTVVLSYNNTNELEDCFLKNGDKIAAVIVEPIAGNMNMVLPDLAFLKKMRELCTKFGSILIFDEVMTGFRVGPEGAQGIYKVEPDITTLGKVIGGGLPIGAFGGRKDIMAMLSPNGPVYQAGTLSGNPIAVSSGLATLKQVLRQGFFEKISKMNDYLVNKINEIGQNENVNISAQSVGGMLGIYFRNTPPKSFLESCSCDEEMFKKFYNAILKKGIYLAPSMFEAGFISSAHTIAEMDKTALEIKGVLRNLS